MQTSMGSVLRLWQHVLGAVRGLPGPIACHLDPRFLFLPLVPLIAGALHAGIPQTFAVALPEQEGPVTL